jgi:hypothetical protein
MLDANPRQAILETVGQVVDLLTAKATAEALSKEAHDFLGAKAHRAMANQSSLL